MITPKRILLKGLLLVCAKQTRELDCLHISGPGQCWIETGMINLGKKLSRSLTFQQSVSLAITCRLQSLMCTAHGNDRTSYEMSIAEHQCEPHVQAPVCECSSRVSSPMLPNSDKLCFLPLHPRRQRNANERHMKVYESILITHSKTRNGHNSTMHTLITSNNTQPPHLDAPRSHTPRLPRASIRAQTQRLPLLHLRKMQLQNRRGALDAPPGRHIPHHRTRHATSRPSQPQASRVYHRNRRPAGQDEHECAGVHQLRSR